MPYKDPEARRAYMRAYKAARAEHMRELNKESYERHKEAIQSRRAEKRHAIPVDERRAQDRQYQAAYRERVPEKLRENQRRWRAAHGDEIRERERLHRIANAERFKATQARYFQRHPERSRALQAERSARRRLRIIEGTEGRVSYVAILARDQGICHICKLAVATGDLHFDHIIPIARGGKHSTDNIAMSHSWCNLSKHTKLI